MIYYSTENLKTETIDKETRDRILSLSYEKFFNDSIKCENDIATSLQSIEDIKKDYANTAKVLKEKFKTFSFESGENSDVVKNKFFTNIKNFFIKVWAAIVTIFEKILFLIQNLIKSLILYIKKHIVIKNSLYTRIKKEDAYLSFNNPSDIMRKHITKMLNEKMRISSITVNDNMRMDFPSLVNTLRTSTLAKFVTTKIIVDNKHSTFNTDALSQLLGDIAVIEGIQGFDGDTKLHEISERVTDFAAKSVLYGEIDGDSQMRSSYNEIFLDQANLYELAKTRNIKGLANRIVFQSDNIKCEDMSLSSFFNLTNIENTESNVSIILQEMRKFLYDYENVADLVIGKGGYLDVLTEVLKRYLVAANKDTGNVKKMKESIIKFMNSVDNNNEEGQKITNRCKKFTNLIVRVQTIKNDFIMLRQHVIGNILTAFSIIDKGLSAILIPGSVKDNDLAKNENDLGKPIDIDLVPVEEQF